MINNVCDSCGIKQLPNPCDCSCDPCKNKCCEKPKPVIDVRPLPSDPLTLSFNFNGVGTTFDFRSLLLAGQTDTSLRVDAVNRALTYNAERHTDSISAKELGDIIHLADLGDVDFSAVDNNSLLVYQKNSDCAQGCDDTKNSWIGWNATENIADSVQYLAGFDLDGSLKSLSSPSNPSQHYSLSWAGAEKVTWTQPTEVATPPSDTNGYAYLQFIDPSTKQAVYMKVIVSISDGVITLRTTEANS